MKVLIVLCAVVAMSVTKAGYLGAGIAAPGIVGAHALGYAAPAVAVARAVPAADAIPAGLALTPNGVPVDTPAVQAGHVANAVAHANANGLTVATAAARGAYYGVPALGYAAGIVGFPALGYAGHGTVGVSALGYAAGLGYAGHGIVGAPALGYVGHGIVGAPALGYAAGIVGSPALGYVGHGIVGVPALGYPAGLGYAGHGIVGAPALGYAGHGVVAGPAVGFASAPADVVPAGLALTPHGVPVDTPAVQAARAADAAAHINAKGLILG